MQNFLLAAEPGVFNMLFPFLLIFGLFYLMLIRPQKKREQQTQQMRSAIEVGDEIVTIGGIIGTVINVKDDWMVIETGSDRSKIRIAKWAVQTNNTPKQVAASAAAPETDAGDAPKKKRLFGKKDEADSFE